MHLTCTMLLGLITKKLKTAIDKKLYLRYFFETMKYAQKKHHWQKQNPFQVIFWAIDVSHKNSTYAIYINTLATWYKQLTYWKRPWCWESLKAKAEEGGRGWNGWMASPIQWTRTWANSGRWWGTGRPGVLQSMGSQRVGHDWATEQQQSLMLTLPLFCF